MMILVWAGAAATGCQKAQSGPIRPTPIAVYDLPIRRVVTDFQEFPGMTDAIYSVQVRARVSGYLTNPVYFKDGSMVQEGDKLFAIDPRLYKADRDRADGTVKQYEAHVRRLERDYQRVKNLLARGAVGQEEYDRYEGDYKEAVANLEVAKANQDLATLNLEWTEVRAPLSGLLSRRMVDPGNLIKADDTVLTSIVSLDPLYVYFDVDEQTMLKLKRLIQEGKVKVRPQGEKAVPVQIGLSDEDDFPHEGIVDFTDNRVDLNTGTLRFRAKISNPPDRHGNRFIVPGLFVRVRLPIGDAHPALLIREQALVTDQGRKTVFVVREKKDKDGKPVRTEKGDPIHVAVVRDVGKIGVLRDGYREIEQGIEPDDWVVVAGMQRLRAGVDVKVERFDDKPSTDSAVGKKETTKTAASPTAGPADAKEPRAGAEVAPAVAVSTPPRAVEGGSAQAGRPAGGDLARSLAPSAPINPPGRESSHARPGPRAGR
jgi:multidrug efflux system membrane fusion protein